jgi:hypothetical protein
MGICKNFSAKQQRASLPLLTHLRASTEPSFVGNDSLIISRFFVLPRTSTRRYCVSPDRCWLRPFAIPLIIGKFKLSVDVVECDARLELLALSLYSGALLYNSDCWFCGLVRCFLVRLRAPQLKHAHSVSSTDEADEMLGEREESRTCDGAVSMVSLDD